jgi:hypothetical protein
LKSQAYEALILSFEFSSQACPKVEHQVRQQNLKTDPLVLPRRTQNIPASQQVSGNLGEKKTEF